MKKILTLLTFLGILSIVSVNSVNAQYGSSSSTSTTSTNTTSAPTCNNDKPAIPVLYEPNHPLFGGQKKLGEVTLHWAKADRATSYNVLYGLSPRNYIYSGLKVGNGDTTTYSVAGLNPGTTYYFTVQANNDCKPGGLSNEWGANAGNFFAASAPQDVLGLKTKRLALNNNVLAADTVATNTPTTVQPSKEVSPTVIQVQEEKTSFFGGIVKFVKSLLGIE
jgi:hypothetical protein